MPEPWTTVPNFMAEAVAHIRTGMLQDEKPHLISSPHTVMQVSEFEAELLMAHGLIYLCARCDPKFHVHPDYTWEDVEGTVMDIRHPISTKENERRL